VNAIVTLPPPGSALTLHMAADRLRRAAQLARDREAEKGRTPADWYSDMVDGYLGGPVGMLCGLLSPELALDLADHLDATAVQAVRYAAGFGNLHEEITDGWPITAARRIIGEAS
jgi:hypothetical protein